MDSDIVIPNNILDACKKATYVIELIDYIKIRYAVRLNLDDNFKKFIFDNLTSKYKKCNGFTFFSDKDEMSQTLIDLHYAQKLSSSGINKEAMHNYLKIRSII